jgi:uncharacterized protein (TIGR02594 family)
MRDLTNTPYGKFIWFIGIAEDTFSDPTQLGRVRVRAIGFHPESKDILPTENLPLAPVLNGGSAKINPGQMVLGFFMDGELLQQPFILGVINGGVSSASYAATGAVNRLEGSVENLSGVNSPPADRPTDGSCPQPKQGLVNSAAAWLGYQERTDKACLMNLFKTRVNSGIDPSVTPWCGAFVGSILSSQGYSYPSAVNSSRAYASPKYNTHNKNGYGTVVWEKGTKESKLDEANIQVGDIAVFKRGPISSGFGHVAFVAQTGFPGNRVVILGGNQSDKVTLTKKSVSDLLSITRPPGKRPETYDATGVAVSTGGSTS